MTPDDIHALREHLQLTQELFARILRVSFATVNRWENGKSEPGGDSPGCSKPCGTSRAEGAGAADRLEARRGPERDGGGGGLLPSLNLGSRPCSRAHRATALLG